MYLAEFLTIAIAHLFAVASPGPDFGIVLRQTVLHGREAGLWTSTGIALGILLHISYCVLGVGVLLASTPALFSLFKAVAAIYLAYLGYRAIRASLEPLDFRISFAAGERASPRSLVLAGFLTNGLNPKVTLFLLALYTVVVDARTPLLVQTGYGIYISVATFGWFAMVSVLLGFDRVRDFLLRAGHWFERIMGLVFILLALQLLFSVAPPG